MNNNITIIYVIYKSGEIFFDNIKRLNNFKKIVVDNDPNSTLEDRIKKIDPTIKVIKNGEIIPLINSSSFMISLGTSLSNVILDAHILQKPVIKILGWQKQQILLLIKLKLNFFYI